ncbi:biotin--[acetyl-CoA-carboxylase] ligase [Desulfocurvus sp. DL9XJH121]
MIESCGILLWAEGREGLAAPLDPEALAKSHPLWAAEVDRRGPWLKRGPWWAPSDDASTNASSVIVCGECGSSLDVARALSADGLLPEWGAVLALSQNSGRGQLRRFWVSPPGNIYAAWRWPSLSAPWNGLVPLVVGGIMAEALEQCGLSVSIKWPNDLLLADGSKVGGILVEERGGEVLVGIGVNLVSAPLDRDIRTEWSPRGGSLSPLGDVFSTISLWQRLVDLARNWYDSRACDADPRSFLAGLEKRVVWLGRRVRVLGAQEEFYAVPVGLAEDGGLILDRQGRREILRSGSIAPD